MPPTIFFSYSHADETLRNQLEVHLTSLKRQGLISTWHDRRIVAGTNVGDAIDENLNAAEVVLLLISSDFIASDYCYEREMARAMERHRNGEARVIPVILRPCDWHDLPFGKLLAAPRDGKAVTTWPNSDEAFLDVERSIKAALTGLAPKGTSTKIVSVGKSSIARPSGTNVWADAVSNSLPGPRSSNLRIKKEFTDLDKDRFRQEAFDYIAHYFDNSMQELVARNSDANLAQRFKLVDATHFTAAVYQNGQKICKGSISISDGMMGRNSIQYSMDDDVRHNGMNEAVSVKADDQKLYFEVLGMQSYGRDKNKLTQQGAAELFWELFIRPLQ